MPLGFPSLSPRTSTRACVVAASLATLVASIFTTRVPSFMFCLLTTFALLFVMRTAKDGISKIKKH